MLFSCCCQRFVPRGNIAILTDIYGGTREGFNYLNNNAAYCNWGYGTDEPFEVRYSTEINLATDVPGQNPLGHDVTTTRGYRTLHADCLLRPQRLTGLTLRTGCYRRVLRTDGGAPILGSVGQRLAGGVPPTTYQVYIDDVAVSPVRTVELDGSWNGRLDFTLPTVTRLHPYRQMRVDVVCTFEEIPLSPDRIHDRYMILIGNSSYPDPLLSAGYELAQDTFSQEASTLEFPSFNNRIYSVGTVDYWANNWWLLEGTDARPIQSPWLSNPAYTTPTVGLWDGGPAVFRQRFALNISSQLVPGPNTTRTATPIGDRTFFSFWPL
jgi:hypothetical protein